MMKNCNGFYFHCEVCNFDLHVNCANFLMPTVEEGCKQLKHPTHMHPLVLVEKKDEVVNRVKCLACGEHCFGAYLTVYTLFTYFTCIIYIFKNIKNKFYDTF